MSSTKSSNAWIVKLGSNVRLGSYSISAVIEPRNLPDIQVGDAMLILRETSGKLCMCGIGRVYRKRYSLDSACFFFDGYLPTSDAEPDRIVSGLAQFAQSLIHRMKWGDFEDTLHKTVKTSWANFPVLSGDSPDEQAYIRDLMQSAIADDLLGPAEGPYEEVVDMSVGDRYLVGKLAPKNSVQLAEDDLSNVEDGQEGTPDRGVSTSQSLVPSSIGFTFCIDGSIERVEVVASWARYENIERGEINEKEPKKKSSRCWKRVPCGGSITIPINCRKIDAIVIDQQSPDVLVQGAVSDSLHNGDRLVTLFIVNDQLVSEGDTNRAKDQAWVFQPQLIVRDPEGRPIFRKRPVLTNDGADDEREALEMIYRKQVEFAVGHGVSVHAKTIAYDGEKAVEIRTSVLPEYEVPVTETPGLVEDDPPGFKRMISEGFLDMENLANLDKDALVEGLHILTEDYDRWIRDQKGRIGVDVQGYDSAATVAMGRCSDVLKRLQDGIETLASNPDALSAFRFTNQAMALQRIRSIYALANRRGEKPELNTVNIRKNRSWRPFQLAFILLSIPALSDPEHSDRTEPIDAYADLLWFPTGGGKTEAYLGVAAFAMAIRRLQKNLGDYDSTRGLAVIMRYTLRLLTLQQFQRATTLICALEALRRENLEKWGDTPFSIGLWVGNRVTPGTTEEAHNAIKTIRDGRQQGGNSPAQLTSCPWCGNEISEGRDIVVDRDIDRTFIYCSDKLGRCIFSRKYSSGRGIPVLVVDDEIYRHPPTMLIATVDKFAMMAWKGQVCTLFGRATHECSRHGLIWPDSKCKGNHRAGGGFPRTIAKEINQIRPPDLIIQDEFHLISGPLGTMVGLYETAIDELSTWQIGTSSIRPKVIASTATVRKAAEQVNNVFLRQVSVFPPHGLDVEDNFFSIQRPVSEKPGRRYLGICSPGSSRPAVLIRVYVAILTAAQELFERFGHAADPYMTNVGYFNSLRELGSMRRLAEDDVQTRAFKVKMSDITRPGLSQRSVKIIEELTSRVSSKDIPKKLDQLEVKFNATFENGKYVSSWEKGDTRAIDIVLATNMLSVGVDVNRLGVMAVNGQPKTTAEYIQATSRVGRQFPGLVCTVLTWSRPRDLSHYETFEHYHATFYKHVEAQSVTPFAPRALDRGLTGTLISLLRLGESQLSPNLGAMEFTNIPSSVIDRVRQSVSNRAWKATDKENLKDNAADMIKDRTDRWRKEVNKGGRRLGYEAEKRQGDVAPLLKKPGLAAWSEFTAPMSMREVEPGVKLIMDTAKLPDLPTWRNRMIDDSSEGEK